MVSGSAGVDTDADAALRDENARLKKVIAALVTRAERTSSSKTSSYDLLQTTIVLEERIKLRTQDLNRALRDNEEVTRALRAAQENMQSEIRERIAVQECLEVEKAEQASLIRKLDAANNQILQSEKLASIGQLAAGVAHEINNPISFVTINLETLRGYVPVLTGLLSLYVENEKLIPDDEGARSRLAAARENAELDYIVNDVGTLIEESLDGAKRVQRIVQDLRNFSRSGSDERAPADLHRAVDAALNILGNEIRFKADVVKELGELPPVDCILSQMNQVFLNLLGNAVQAIREHGTITLRSGSGNGWAWISVTDTGEGVPPEIIGRIFDPFFTTKPVGTGTGLGLSVSYGIVKSHGGRIDVDSRLGEGSTFTVHLPLVRP